VSSPRPTRAPWAPTTRYAPYGDESRDLVYDLLFADDAAAFRATGIGFEPDAGVPALTKLAGDDTAESRIRALAFRSLRELGATPEPLPLLGVIVEVGLDEGLDTLAAYADGRARYINHAAGVSVVEGGGPIAAHVEAVIEAARPVAAAIGPWTDERRPPPGAGMLRLSFLVGDELRFGEGRLDLMAGDPMAGPVFAAATRLLVRLTELAPKP